MAKFYLLFSAAGLAVVALSYGIAPNTILPWLLNVKVEGVDLSHIFRAVMGLYLGMIVLWLIGAFRPDFTRAAVVSEIFFMLGLAGGRLLSLAVEGVPSIPLVLYTFAEIALGIWGIVVLRQLSADGPDRRTE